MPADRDPDDRSRPLVWREPGPRGWGRTTGGAMLWALAGAVLLWFGSSALLEILRQEFDVAVPRPLRSWGPPTVFLLTLVVLSYALVRRTQRLAAAGSTRPAAEPNPSNRSDDAAGAADVEPDPAAPAVPSRRSTAATVGSSLGIGALGALIGGGLSLAGGILVILLAQTVAPEYGYLAFFLPVPAVIGALIGAVVALGRRR